MGRDYRVAFERCSAGSPDQTWIHCRGVETNFPVSGEGKGVDVCLIC